MCTECESARVWLWFHVCICMLMSACVSERMHACVGFVRVCLCMCVYLGACVNCDLQGVCMCVYAWFVHVYLWGVHVCIMSFVGCVHECGYMCVCVRGLSGKAPGPAASGFLLDLEVVISPLLPDSTPAPPSAPYLASVSQCPGDVGRAGPWASGSPGASRLPGAGKPHRVLSPW